MAENPNFISEDQAQQMESAGLWNPLEQPPVSPTAKVPPPQTSINSYGGVPLPQNLGLQPDLTKTIYPPSTAPIRLMPIVQTAAANAASKSVATTVVQKAISELNIPQPTAQVTDGLIHGETPWESDPSFVLLRDDFAGVINTAATSPLQSELPWSYVNANAITFASWPTAFPMLGGVRVVNAGTTSESSFYQLGNAFAGSSGPSVVWPLFDYPNWRMTWVFQLGKAYNTNVTDVAWSWTQVSFYLGLANYVLVNGSPVISTVPRPQYFVGLRYDTDTTSPSIGDTQFVFEAVSNSTITTISRANLNTQGNTSATGITAVEGHEYRFEMQSTAAGSVTMTLTDGTAGTTYSATLAVPQFTQVSSNNSIFGQTSGSTTTEVLLKNTGNSNLSCPFGPGSQVTIAGITRAGFTGNNGKWTIIGGGGGSAYNAFYFSGGQFTAGSTVTVNGIVTGNPAFLPCFTFGNDTSASPVANSKGVVLDFFSFIWNPGVGGGTGTPNPLKARYF